MTRFEYYAANVPDDWKKQFWPNTLGDVRDAMIARGIIPTSRAGGDVVRSYNRQERQILYATLAGEYATQMIEVNCGK